MHPAQSGDPACCRSGLRHLRLVLRDHELVRLPPDQIRTRADLRAAAAGALKCGATYALCSAPPGLPSPAGRVRKRAGRRSGRSTAHFCCKVRSGLAHPIEWYNSIGARRGASVGLTTAVEAILPSRPAPLILAAAGLLAAAGVAAPANGEEYHCRRNDLVRRVEVQFADDADRLPCQVVYWRDTERPGEKQVPWNAENQIEFCTGKARRWSSACKAPAGRATASSRRPRMPRHWTWQVPRRNPSREPPASDDEPAA